MPASCTTKTGLSPAGSHHLVGVAVEVAQQVGRHALGHGEALARAATDLVDGLDAAEDGAVRVARGQGPHHVEHRIAERLDLAKEAGGRAGVRAGSRRHVEQDGDAGGLGPVEGAVHIGEAPGGGAGHGALLAKDEPRNLEAHRVEATRGDAREVALGDEGLTVLCQHGGVAGRLHRVGEGRLVKGAGAREQRRGHPRLEHEPAGEVDAVERARALGVVVPLAGAPALVCRSCPEHQASPSARPRNRARSPCAGRFSEKYIHQADNKSSWVAYMTRTFGGVEVCEGADCGGGGLRRHWLRRSLGRGRELASRTGVPLSPRRPGLSPVSSKRGPTDIPPPQWV